jgi:subtilisin family serine protease
MDQARIETRVDEAVANFGVTGKGTIIALLDRGIDWRNNDFRNADGSTRIKWIFDLTDDSGANAPGNTFGKGTIYSEAQINAALNGGPALAHRDAVGHGSTTAESPRATGATSRSIMASLRKLR